MYLPWLQKRVDTVDGRNLANQLRLVVFSHCLQGFIHSRWCRVSSINSIMNRDVQLAHDHTKKHFSHTLSRTRHLGSCFKDFGMTRAPNAGVILLATQTPKLIFQTYHTFAACLISPSWVPCNDPCNKSA